MSRTYRLYLEDILEAIEKVKLYTKGLSQDAFAHDSRTFDAVVRNLEIIGEAVKNLPDEVKKANPQIEWRRIAGMRDILTHQYFGISVNIVWDAAVNKLPELEAQVRSILRETT